jgi:hypothetical protein
VGGSRLAGGLPSVVVASFLVTFVACLPSSVVIAAGWYSAPG